MKKLGILTLLVMLMILFTATVYAKNGDIVGNIYSSDILALVNGKPIKSYSLDGKTAIVAEDLANYGFSCRWNQTERILTVNIQSGIASYYDQGSDIKRGKTGKIAGHIYETDIKVIFNGQEIKGYALNGTTAICIEDLGILDNSANRKYGYSKYLAKAIWDKDKRTIELKTPQFDYQNYRNNFHCFKFSIKDNILTAEYDPLKYLYYGGSSGTDESTAGFWTDKYTLKPFYVEAGGKKSEIGVCFHTDANDMTFFDIYNIDEMERVLTNLKPPRKTYDKALEYLYNQPDYTVYLQAENDNYTILALIDNDTQQECKFIAVKKTGGYLFIDSAIGGVYWDAKTFASKIEIEFNKNTVTITYPFYGGPPGSRTTKAESSHNLDSLSF